MAKLLPLSPAFRKLQSRIGELKKFLLPSATSITAPTFRVQTRALAFRVLAHAEIEAYVEERVRDVVDTNIKAWEADKKPRTVLMSLLGFCGEAWDAVTDEASKTKTKKSEQSLQTRLHLAAHRHSVVVNSNHGIKESNLLKMLIPVSISKDQLDNTWLASMDSFGGARGAAAHGSGSGKAVNPADEAKAVEEILNGMRALDRQLTALT